MKFIKLVFGCTLLGISSIILAQTSHIKPESIPPSKEGALTMQDILPVFARPFIAPPQQKDDKVASNQEELFKDEK